jgi:hypothetical protein
MADRKNQHFVPKALLKPWTLGEEGKAINLYNIRSDRGVRNAPVKNQCSRDYFYGADLRIETWLGRGEGVYSQTLAPLPIDDAQQTAASLEILRDFTYLQQIRTERSLAEEARMLREMYDHIFHGSLPDGEEIPSHEEIVAEAIDRWRQTSLSLHDLKGVLVINESPIPFVVSDDPAVHTNKLHTHRLRHSNFGIQQSGMMLTMPVSTRLAVLFYDGDVYTIPDKVGFNLTIQSENDARAFNELQFIKANENIYFQDWNQLDAIREGFAAVRDRRLDVHFRFNLLVPIEGHEGRYRVSDDISLTPEGSSIIHLESVSFYPRIWPSKLRYRHDMHGYSDGSAAGYARRRWAEEQGLTGKDKVRFRSIQRH